MVWVRSLANHVMRKSRRRIRYLAWRGIPRERFTEPTIEDAVSAAKNRADCSVVNVRAFTVHFGQLITRHLQLLALSGVPRI